MGAKKNEIIVGSLTDPIATFTNDDVQNVNSEQSVSLVGQELSIDTLSTTVLLDNTGKSNKKVVYCPRKTVEGYTIKELFGGGNGVFTIFGATTADDFKIIYRIKRPSLQNFAVFLFDVAYVSFLTFVRLLNDGDLIEVQLKHLNTHLITNIPDEFTLEIEKNDKFTVSIDGVIKGQWDIEETDIPQINRENILRFNSGIAAYCKEITFYVNGRLRV